MKIHLDETRASCSPSQSKCCQKPRAASAKCRVFPVYLIIFSPKRKDILSVSLQYTHHLFSITPNPEQREESRVFLVPSDYLYLMEKDAASVFSRNINRSEKPKSQSSNLLVTTNSLLERSAVIEDKGDYQFSSSKFLFRQKFSCEITIRTEQRKMLIHSTVPQSRRQKQLLLCCD